MIAILTSYLFLYLAVVAKAIPTADEYLRLRQQTLQREDAVRLGANQLLEDPREVKVNEILMRFKSREYEEGVDSNGAHFAATKHFFHSKPLIESSNVFKIIRMLPKGASLHLHDDSVPSIEWAVQELSHMDNLYFCEDSDYHLHFRFFDNPPTNTSECVPNKPWTLVSDFRKAASSSEFVDALFIAGLSMYTPQPQVEYRSANEVWKVFEAKIAGMAGMSTYVPALRKHFYQTLLEHYEDNVMYLEERGLLVNVYHGNQELLTPVQILEIKEQVVKKFKEDHPDFWGAKYIYAPHRFHTPEQLSELVDNAIEMKEKLPDFFAGFDLVGQEDLGSPLVGFLPQLLKAAEKGIKFFFHAGETAWHGTRTDENLVDAILLNTTRIGHAVALASHPWLAEEVIKRRIYVESCPISNQVLKLVDDLRNHPVISLMKEGFPLVVGSDDPGIWGASALSYDWYVAFMAMAGAHADLRFLKQLALNSIDASAMSTEAKLESLEKWAFLWSSFLDRVLATYDTHYEPLEYSPKSSQHDELR